MPEIVRSDKSFPVSPQLLPTNVFRERVELRDWHLSATAAAVGRFFPTPDGSVLLPVMMQPKLVASDRLGSAVDES